jgi:hypothetical protein
VSGEKKRGEKPKAPKVALDAVCGRPSEKIVLFTIAQLCDWKTGYFDRPVETLMQRTGLCRRSVQEAVTRLRAKGWLLGNDHRQHGIRVHYLALDGPEGAATAEDQPSGPFDDWRVEEILTWARELGLRPTGADRAVAQEWIERGFSRLLILGTLRLGVQRKRRQRDGEPIGSLRYFDSVRRDLSPEKPDDDVRSSFVKLLGNQLGHKPPLPVPPAVARRLFRQERSRRQALEAAPPRTGPQVTGEGRLAVAAPVAIGAAVAGLVGELLGDHGQGHDARQGEHHAEGPGPAQGGRAEHPGQVLALEPGGDRRAEQERFEQQSDRPGDGEAPTPAPEDRLGQVGIAERQRRHEPDGGDRQAGTVEGRRHRRAVRLDEQHEHPGSVGQARGEGDQDGSAGASHGRASSGRGP